MPKTFFLGANWKMHTLPVGALHADSPYHGTKSATVVVFPTYLDLVTCRNAHLVCGAQFARAEDAGAFTGDISMAMLKALDISYVLCGHSERRRHYKETDLAIGSQAAAAAMLNIIPVVCIGETLAEREQGKTEAVLEKQLSGVCPPPSAIIAYEPVWAIGTGKTPSPKEIQAVHRFIRTLLPDKKMRILYGGSMTAKNAHAILHEPDVDGGLIGGASLDPKEFAAIVKAASA
jgi:triosephosphate isomerase